MCFRFSLFGEVFLPLKCMKCLMGRVTVSPDTEPGLPLSVSVEASTRRRKVAFFTANSSIPFVQTMPSLP